MRILHAVHCFPPEPTGGTERVAASLVRGLAARGHELHVVAGSLAWEKGAGVGAETWEGIPVTRIRRDDPWFDRWDNGYNPEVEATWRALLRDLRPDLVHVHHWIRLTRNLVQAAREEGIPAVVQLHDFQATCPRTFRLDREERFCLAAAGAAPCLQCAERWPFQGDVEIGAHLDHYRRDMANELRGAGARLTLSRAQQEILEATLEGPVGPMEQLPVASERVLTPRGGKPADPALRVVHWGNLYDLKGVGHLVRAVRAAAREVAIRLDLYGPAVEEEYRRELERLAGDGPVTLHGAYRREELETVAADLAVFPSLCRETYSLVVDEACMLGLPLVVSDAGALPERIGGGGVVVPPGDEEALRAVLVDLARDRERLAALAAAVPHAWSTEAEVAEIAEAIYARVLAAGDELPAPVDPVTPEERLRLSWFTAAMRLASLAGSPVDSPPPWRVDGGS